MKRFVFAVILLISVTNLFATSRRHIIVLQDNSGSYFNVHNESQIKEVQNQLIGLFANQKLGNDYNLLNEELSKGLNFYDSGTDKVSFVWFVSGQKDNYDFYTATNGEYGEFEKRFFKNGRYELDEANDISSFLKLNFSNRPVVEGLNNHIGLSTYSFSAYAYPLCMDLCSDDYTDEYVVIIVSDFNAGSTFGNRNDEKIFKDAFKKKSEDVIKRVNQLNSRFFKIDYFDYYLTTRYNGLIGFTGFKIRPKAGTPISENLDLRLNSDIGFEQKSFGDDIYTMNNTKIVFAHNDNLCFSKLVLTINLNDGNVTTRDITESVIYDSLNNTYIISPIKDLKLNGHNNIDANFSGEASYKFFMDYKIGNDKTIGYVYNVNRTIEKENFNFKTELSNTQITMMVIGILLLVGLLIAVVLFLQGRPTGLLIRWNPFNDNYETTDFSETGKGKIHTDYKVWTPQDEQNGRTVIKFRGRLSYRNVRRFYNWKEETGFNVRITPLELIVPEGFTVFIESNNKVASNTGTSIVTDNFHDGIFDFMAIIQKNDDRPINAPILFGLKILVETRNIGIKKFYYPKTVDYSFHLGPDLGDVWIGVDPGTTGSCIATATSTQDITIEKTQNGNDYIAPSVICINTAKLKTGTENDIRQNTIFGDRAQAIKESDSQDRKKFVSIKKLLGYNNTFDLTNSVSVPSSFLSTLLIEGVFHRHKSYIEKPEFANEFEQFKTDGSFNPKRGVFAIPNNFTATKIQHLKECIKKVKGANFVDVRFIYEAEAILVNYINSQNEGSTKLLLQESPNGEYVFIYDMGGATINATLANVKKRKENKQDVFEIEILAKLGYGIGGDTIDYAFLKWIYSKEDSYSTLRRNNPFNMNNQMSMQERRQLKDEVLTLKKEVIKRFHDDSTTLLDRTDIRNFHRLNLDLLDEENDPFVTDIDKKGINFLNGEYFQDYIWNNIRSIVNDIATICEKKSIPTIDTLIMSGRSSHFPMVKETVARSISSKFKSVDIQLLDLEESKSAVAKGACFYGVQNSNFKLKNRTVNGVFGVIQTESPNSAPKFLEIINDGDSFAEGLASGTRTITGNNGFPWDGRKVRFCQVMGVNPSKVIANAEKHKYTELAIIKAQPLEVRSVHISVSEKDKVTCSITDVNGDPQMPAVATANDADIISCNDEQYTFFVKQS